ncbi:MAG: NYN domain-containing protein [Thiotrichales bacterium]
MPTAILIDGGFFLKRYRTIFADDWMERTPTQVAEDLHKTMVKHLHDKSGEQVRELYRILYYDCPPLTKKLHKPISKQSYDAGKSREAQFRLGFFENLRRLRKVALRLGHLSDHIGWRLKPNAQKALLSQTRQIVDLTDDDFEIETRQKGVDMKIGVDIASLAFKHQVDQIVLVAGDGDFVLDPMWATIPDDLHEHVDGLQSMWPRPKPRSRVEPK